MKRFYIRYLMLTVFSVCVISAMPSPVESQDEEAAVRAAVEDYYIKALKVRDFSLIRTICTPDAKLMGSRQSGELRVTTLDKWSARFDPTKPPPFKHLDATIAKIDVVGTAAQVRIDFVIEKERPVTDFLNMVKISGKWRIVNIIDY